MSTLIVWAISDGKPGHVSQTHGLLAALDEEYDLAVHWLSCPLRFSGFKSLLRWCARFIPSSLQTLVMGLAYRMPEEPSQPPDLIVSAGGNTLFAAGHLARRHGACSVFSGSTKRYPEAWISLVVSVTPTQAINNLVLALPPASGLKQRPNIARPADTEPKEVQDFKPTLSSVSTLPPQSRPLTGALLIGGDGAGCRYLPSDWHRLAALLTDCYAHPLDWLTTTSRRTGEAAEEALQRALEIEGISPTRAVWWQQSPERVIGEFFAACDFIVCTIDSLSMMAEAIYTGKPVLIFAPQHALLSDSDALAIQKYRDAGFIQDLDGAVRVWAEGGSESRAPVIQAQICQGVREALSAAASGR